MSGTRYIIHETVGDFHDVLVSIAHSLTVPSSLSVLTFTLSTEPRPLYSFLKACPVCILTRRRGLYRSEVWKMKSYTTPLCGWQPWIEDPVLNGEVMKDQRDVRQCLRVGVGGYRWRIPLPRVKPSSPLSRDGTSFHPFCTHSFKMKLQRTLLFPALTRVYYWICISVVPNRT